MADDETAAAVACSLRDDDELWRLTEAEKLGCKMTNASLQDTCQQTPKTTTDKCEEDGNDIHSTGDSTSTLNSNDAADTKSD
eukprot:scaffold124170_cov114-Cyclotella_meneghiniana.AAC.2